MNDLMPPPRRPVPARLRRTVHALVDTTGRTYAGSSPLRRWGAPLAVAGAVAVVAVSGVLLASGAGSDGPDGTAPADGGVPPAPGGPSTQPPAPTDSRSTQPPAPTDSPPGPSTPAMPAETPSTTRSLPPTTVPPTPGTDTTTTAPETHRPPSRPLPSGVASAPMADPGPAYEQCAGLAERAATNWGWDARDLTGLASAEALHPDTELRTVLVGNDSGVWACNLAPDRALSRAASASPPEPAEPATWALALNDARNYGFERGELAWAGGVLPDGVDEVSYHFADGHEQRAVVTGDHWVLQDLTDEPWSDDGQNFRVRLDGPAGSRTVEVRIGAETQCNQVSHGC